MEEFSKFLDEVITDHEASYTVCPICRGGENSEFCIDCNGTGRFYKQDCTDYAIIKCNCKSGECEQRFRDGKLGNNDLEQFDKEALEYFIKFINFGLNDLSVFAELQHGPDLVNLQALRMMMYNAKNKKNGK